MLITLVLISFPLDTEGEGNNIKFRHITIEDGLSQTSVEAIIQDSKGYIWFGTSDGLNKYNGEEFKIYKNKLDNANSLTGNYVDAIVEDKDGYIWIGTSAGLNKLNPNTDEIIRYTKDPNNPNSISHNNVWDIMIDSNDFIWIATGSGLNKYDTTIDKFTSYYIDDSDKDDLGNFITCVYEDSKGTIWAGTKNGLNSFNPNTEEFTRYLHNKDNRNSITDNYIYRVYEDGKGNIWVGTRKGGLNKYDRQTNTFKSYTYDEKDSSSIASNTVKTIFEDKLGDLWIGSKGGLSKYNKVTDDFTHFQNKYYDRDSLVENHVMKIFEDKTGLIWLGTYKGISTFFPEQKFIHYKKNPIDNNSLNNNMVSGIYKDEEGILWIGTSNGLNRINRETGEITHYLHKDNNPNSLSHDRIRHITGDGNGNIWIATDNGLSKYNKETDTFKNFYNERQNENSLVNNEVRYLHFDYRGILWIGTRHGLNSYNEDTNEFTNYYDLFKEYGVTDDYISAIYEDDRGIMWVGTANEGGLIRFDRSTNTIKIYQYKPSNKRSLSSNSVKSVAQDSNGNIWIGTSNGLNKLNVKSEMFTRFSEEDGLSNNYIYGVLIDDSDNVWCSTNRGIFRLDVSKGEFSNYYVTDGLQSNEFNGRSYFKSEDGEMFFGGIDGFNIFCPKNLRKDTYETKVVINDFKIYGKTKEFKNNNKLNYKENYFSFEFFLPDYRNTFETQYAYKLEGIDKDWVYTKDRNYATYTNVEGGRYNFYVKGKNGYSDWSKPTVITIDVEKPPWRRWWAYTLYTLILLLFIYIVANYVKLLEKLIKQRTIELNNKLDENEKLYKKLIDYEKFKNDFFVNLAHEIRTPVNVILSTLQLYDKYNEDDNNEKTGFMRHIAVIRRNSLRLLKVVNNIIDTSKINEGKYRINTTETDIVYLVEEVTLSMKEYIESNDLKLIFDTEIEEKSVECDPNEIERCIINLISNAVKFSECGGNIWVNIYDKDNKIEISVKDNGIGISHDKKQFIFERFKQVENNISSRKSGSGIGLTLVKSLIELHGGTVSVESDLGKGSEFIITLPVKAKGEQDAC